jgi:phosphoribosylanthranilate isomerase
VNRPAIKFCGITRTEDAWAAADNGAAAIGFIFAPGSPRLVTAEAARTIGRTLPPFVQRVGVFVDAPSADVRALAAFAELDVVQLHGHESVQDALTVWPRVIKALARDRDLGEQAAAWSDEITLLVDAATGDAPGGTGQLADWPAAAALARERRVVLAGGLTAEKDAEANAVVRPYAVDVSSGIEIRPGVKSASRMRAFAWAVESALSRNKEGRNDEGRHDEGRT